MIIIKTISAGALALSLALAAMTSAQGVAYADANDAARVEATASEQALPSKEAASPESERRYSLPWQLRPMTIGNLARVDSAASAFTDDQGNLDIAVATVLAASYRLTPQWTPMIRLGYVGNNAPGAALDGTSFANPVVGATYALPVSGYKLALFGATTIPVGTGAGTTPNRKAAKTNTESMVARPADTAMFAVKYVTMIAGADVAYMSHGFTAQAEATLLQFVRVRGSDSKVAPDELRTQVAAGLHLGYFIGSHVSLSSDVTYQRWLVHPANANMLTVAVGPRAHFRLSKQTSLRPGISVMRGLDRRGFDAPLVTAQTTAIQLDVPVTF